MAESRRTGRVEGLILQEVSHLLRRVVKDPRVEGVTFTSARVTRDLRIAHLYFSVVGDERRRVEAESGLQSAKGIIKRELGRHLKLRYMPEIEFHFDASLAHAEHIRKLLKQVEP